MDIIIYLIPFALILVGIGIYGVFWSIKNQQFDDMESAANKTFIDDDPTH
jgi:cbb3-type cytochrome oxidase maturation protein